jgi:hypothetical protein
MIESAEEFARLRRSEVPEEYNRANDESAPLSVWLDVLRDYPELRRYVAYNSTSPIAILKVLASDDDWLVRHAVARREDLDADMLRTLAHDQDEGVRARVCWNPSTPRDVLEYLAATEWFEPNLERVKERLAALD